MGVNSRQRRRAKQPRRRKADTIRRSQVDERVVRGAVLAAAQAFRFEPTAVYESRRAAVERLGSRAALRACEWWAQRALEQAWESGWQPADVLRALRRTLTPGHVEAVVAAVEASASRRPEAAADPRWADQVAGLATEAGRPTPRGTTPELAVAVEAVAVLLYLPPLPRLSSGLGREGTTSREAPSGAMLQRVRALLAKAESTTFPEEAEALTAKAQELMARHAIDEAMLDAADPASPAGVAAWRIGVDDPYAGPKSQLLARVAAANRCSSVYSPALGFSTVFGVTSDLEMVELLFTSLLVQGTDAMLRAGRSVDRDGRSRTRSFRQSFLLAYAARIGERLDEATQSMVADGAERHGDALLPVLASRAAAVDEAVSATFPRLEHRGLAVNNYSGWVAGRAAADLASIAVGEALEPAG